MRWRLGVDVGGTFTDFLLADEDGNAQIHKTSSTPQDPSIGLMNGLAELADLKGLGLLDFVSQIELIVHGTTVATNAVLTETGATTGLLTTEGFRDALEMRRGIREELYNNKYTAPRPLVPRRLRLPVRERIDYAGQAVVPLHKDSVYEAARAFRKQGVQAVAICFMHAYANSEHEQVAAEILTQE
ncbi:MAG: hydantoinase/oxoprolinase family protein, partial [Chloroflexi bacterium]|nr:hydantoinase/oxoprolinase family protein [Chloroflexota bacterium]